MFGIVTPLPNFSNPQNDIYVWNSYPLYPIFSNPQNDIYVWNSYPSTQSSQILKMIFMFGIVTPLPIFSNPQNDIYVWNSHPSTLLLKSSK